ncbi:MAG: hypothetical protein HOW73_21530 [Polyangiaceae bacterium]|nr:hypothetical protein [Polyangiaceae bacterium]
MLSRRSSCPALLLIGSMALLLACGDSGDTGGGGQGGGEPPAGGSAADGGQAPLASCDVIGVCTPPEGTIDPYASCLGCAIAGSTDVVPEGGICGEDYVKCFGSDGSCSEESGGLPDCCAFYDCFDMCDTDMDGIEDGAELDCFCTNQEDPETGALNCVALEQQQPGTCVGDHKDGLVAALDFEVCIFGQDPGPEDDVCPTSCAER